jgi:hypothetical protein
MSDRGFLFLFSLLMIFGGIATAVWLVINGQAATVDGLFLALTALLFSLGFALYLKFLIRTAKEKAAPPKSATASRA